MSVVRRAGILVVLCAFALISFFSFVASPLRAGLNEETAPIDNLFEAWRTLDTRLYIVQWAPNAVKIDLRTGQSQQPPALLADRTRLFGQLARVDVGYVPRLEWSDGNEALVHVRYRLTLYFRAGRTVVDAACENYRLRKYRSEWLIVRNEDYARCNF